MNKKENKYLLEELYKKFVEEFNTKKAKKIFKILQDVIGNKRITLHTRYFLYKERNTFIINNFTGRNYEELAAVFGLSEHQIRRIVHPYGKKNADREDKCHTQPTAP